MSVSWTATLTREQPLAVVADGRGPGLVQLLALLHAQWGVPFSVWLSEGNQAVSDWAAGHGLQVRDLSDGPALAVRAPCLTSPLVLTAGVTHPGQLLFVGQGCLSREGILLGGLYALASLVPGDDRPKVSGDWNQLLLELYRRFGGCPVVVPIRAGDDLQLLGGDPWAIDEGLLSRLPSRAGGFHVGVRRLLLPPAAITDWPAAHLMLPQGAISAYPCGLGRRILYRVWARPRERFALVRDKITMMVRFRLRRFWGHGRGLA